jgi:hypothetical protein
MKKFIMPVAMMVLAMVSLASAGNRVRIPGGTGYFDNLRLSGFSSDSFSATLASQKTNATDGAITVDSDVFTADIIRLRGEGKPMSLSPFSLYEFSAANIADLHDAVLEYITTAGVYTTYEARALLLKSVGQKKSDIHKESFNRLTKNGTVNPVITAAMLKFAESANGESFSSGCRADNAFGVYTLDNDTILSVMVAPEFELNQSGLDLIKEELKKRAVVGARKTLRKAGKSFVSYQEVIGEVTNTINPIDATIKPVVDALNAANLAGIEEAFAGIGITIKPVDRTGLSSKVVTDVRDQIIDGTLLGTESPGYFPKMVILLGVDGFNAFVAEYNSGGAPKVMKMDTKETKAVKGSK